MPRQILISLSRSTACAMVLRSFSVNSGRSASNNIAQGVATGSAPKAQRNDAFIPSDACATGTGVTSNPASAAYRGWGAGGRATNTGPVVTARAIRACRRINGIPSTCSSSLSRPRIRVDAPAASRMIARSRWAIGTTLRSGARKRKAGVPPPISRASGPRPHQTRVQ